MASKKIELAKLTLSPLASALALALATVPVVSHAATLTVTSATDEGGKSLSEAIGEAAGTESDDTIVFDASLSGATVALDGVAFYENSGSIIIDGSNAKGMTVKMLANNNYGIEAEGQSVELNNLNVVLESPEGQNPGIAFYVNDGALNLNNVVIEDKSASSTIVALSFASDLSLANVLLTGNTSVEDEGTMAGFFAKYGNVDVESSVITGVSLPLAISSEAEGSGGCCTVRTDRQSININNSLFANNGAAKYSEGESSPFSGVIIEANKNHRGNLSLEINVSNTTFSGNSSTASGGLVIDANPNDSGHSMDVKANVFNSTFVNNTGYAGAGINAYGKVDLRLAHVTMTGNGPAARPGDVETDYATPALTFAGSYNSSITVANSIIAGNTTSKYNDALTSYVLGQAGDVFISSNNIKVNSSLIGLEVIEEGESAIIVAEDGNIIGEDPKFKTELQINKKGVTPTLCIAKNSPAVDAGDAKLTEKYELDLDQSGKNRLNDDAPDMGAVEYSATCAKKSSDSGIFGSLGTFSLTSLLGLAWFRRKKA